VEKIGFKTQIKLLQNRHTIVSNEEQQQITNMKHQINEFQLLLKQTQTNSNKIESVHEQIQMQIHQTFEQLAEKLNQKKQQLLTQLESLITQQQNAVQIKNKKITQYLNDSQKV
jgi:hypothetical protein